VKHRNQPGGQEKPRLFAKRAPSNVGAEEKCNCEGGRTLIESTFSGYERDSWLTHTQARILLVRCL
jgi:hypothetical protein